MAKHVKAPKEPGFTLGASSVLPCWHSGGKALTMVPQLSLEKKKKTNKPDQKLLLGKFESGPELGHMVLAASPHCPSSPALL